MSKSGLGDWDAESKAHELLLLPANQHQLAAVDEFTRARSKSDRPVEDRSVERLMALARELAWGDRQQARPPAEDRQPRDEDRESDSDRPVAAPPVMSPRPKRSWELTVGYFILLVLGIVVFSVWIRTNTNQIAALPEFTVLNPAKSGDTIATPQPTDSSAITAATNKALRFAEFGCASPMCTLSCNANERIANAFALSPGGTFVYEDDRTVSFRPLQLPSRKITLVCIPR
jgi:hypothetical protein